MEGARWIGWLLMWAMGIGSSDDKRWCSNSSVRRVAIEGVVGCNVQRLPRLGRAVIIARSLGVRDSGLVVCGGGSDGLSELPLVG